MRLLALLLLPVVLPAAMLRVTVFDEKTGEVLPSLARKNFAVVDGGVTLPIQALRMEEQPLDVMLVVDASLVGEMIAPFAAAFIDRIEGQEQMAIVTYHSSAELLQDFTDSKQILHQSFQQIQFGNNPRVLDALFAAMDGGFESSIGRRVIVLLSAGVEGSSRTTEGEILELAQRRGVSIFPVYVVGAERGMFRRLAERSAGATYSAKKLDLQPAELADRVFEVLRNYYEIEVESAFSLGNSVEVQVRGLPKDKKKVVATRLVLE